MWQTIQNDFSSLLQPETLLVGLSACILLIAIWSSRRSAKRIPFLEKQLTQARNDLRALTTASIGVGGRVLELERRLRRLAEKQKEVDIYDSANQPYDHAIDLAKQGMKVDDIVAHCGISRNEAELIQMMHRFKQTG